MPRVSYHTARLAAKPGIVRITHTLLIVHGDLIVPIFHPTAHRPQGHSPGRAMLIIGAVLATIGLGQPSRANAQQTSARARPTGPATAFRWAGEEFYYSIRLNGAEAMRARLRAGHLRRGNHRAYVPLSATAQSVGFFENVYPVDDRANTFMRVQPYRPLRSEKTFREAGEMRAYRVDYAHSQFRAAVKKQKETTTFRYNYSIPRVTHDMISWLYDLRSRENLQVGSTFSYYIYDGWKLSRVDMQVQARKDVYTPMGWFKGWKISFVREVLESHKQKTADGQPTAPALSIKSPHEHAGYLYLSRDENRLPIKVAIATKFGTSEALLVKYKPHQKPSNHRVVDQSDATRSSQPDP